MYTFYQLTDAHMNYNAFPVIFGGGFMVAFIMSVVFLLEWMIRSIMLVWFAFFVILVITYHNVYVPCRAENIPTPAKFVQYLAEGSREKHGKHYVDMHYIYGIYDVNGKEVIMQIPTNSVIAKDTILYFNKNGCNA
jgi:hypothetical protein